MLPDLPIRLRSDPDRPIYHFLPPDNWMNDPNGLIQWGGRYHLFYQHNPDMVAGIRMHWGHAVSEDLAHWRHLPIALAPTPGGPDKDGVWSGCAVDDNGVPTLIYTGVFPQVQCLATSADDLLTWEKDPGNPVLAAPPPGMQVVGFRDPSVWKEGETWQMLVGAGEEGGAGTALLYRSHNLREWEYRGRIFNDDKPGMMWECPGLFPLGDRHVFIVTPAGENTTLAYIGTYADETFTAERRVKVDYGELTAAQVFQDAHGRRILFGWALDQRRQDVQLASGWAGMMALPRVLTLLPEGNLGVAPAPDLAVLRREQLTVPAREIDGEYLLPPHFGGDAIEIALEIDPGTAGAVGITVRRSADGAEGATLCYDRAAGTLSWQTQGGTLGEAGDKPSIPRVAPLPLAPGDSLRLRIFVDRSILEAFANDHVALTGFVYPRRPHSTGIALATRGGPATLRTMEVWTMGPAFE